MRISVSVTAVVALVAAIVGASVFSAFREQRRLLAEFTDATQRQAHASVDLLSARLDALDQDTRLLIDLVERSRRDRDLDLPTELRIWTTAFKALATLVPQYRTICLFHSSGTLEVLAQDPTEDQLTVNALIVPSRRLANAVAATGTKALGRPATRYGERAFLLYGTPVAGGGAVVVASDAAIFLGGMAWTPLPASRLFVTDPAGIVWSGCETTNGCRATNSGAAQSIFSLPAGAISTVAPEIAEGLGLGRTAAVRISEGIARPTGSWTVTWVASSKAIVDRECWLLFRLVATTLTAAIGVAGVGAVILRQQRKAVALQSQLKYTQALASARETSAAIVENAPLGVLGVSQAGTVVLVNRFLTDRLGPITVGGHMEKAFSGEGEIWIRNIAPALAAAVADDESADSPPAELLTVATPSHQFHVRVVPVRNHELGIRAFALADDQSELRRLESHLSRAEKLITVGVLSAGIAHEIGSPLAVIRGRAEQVLRHVHKVDHGDPLAPPQAIEDLRVIIKHIDHISSTIRQLLDFSRRQPIVRQPVSLAMAVERARALLLWKLDARNVTLRVTFPYDLPPLAADPDQLQQVLVNLLLNACDASQPGQQISLQADAARAGCVRLEISDQGFGIAPEHMSAVFDPFFTTKKRGEGTGLGLPIAASIVRIHAGDINIASAPDKGTTVTIVWPEFAGEQSGAEMPVA